MFEKRHFETGKKSCTKTAKADSAVKLYLDIFSYYSGGYYTTSISTLFALFHINNHQPHNFRSRPGDLGPALYIILNAYQAVRKRVAKT